MNRYQEAQQKMIVKFRWSAPLAAEAGMIPYKSEGGKWIPSPYAGNGWWTGGFWPGLMWQMYQASGEKMFREAALRLTDGLLEKCSDWTRDRCGVLTHCTASYHDDGAGRHTNITYGDYFLVEALAKCNGTDPMLWL